MKRLGKQKILPRPGDLVKGRIVAAGVKLADLAAASRISQSALSNYLAGIRCDWAVQVRIWDAYQRLTKQRISLQEFWGRLLSERIAG